MKQPNKAQKTKKVDSSVKMDCHADKSARNDRKRGFFTQDSRSCGGAVDFHRLQRILGFCDDFGGFQGSGKGAYLIVCNRRHCRRIHQKRAKAESTSETKTESMKGVTNDFNL